MTANEARHWPGRSFPAGHEPQSGVSDPLVLELVIADTDPLTGTVRPAGGRAPVAFHGWIDLMAAISSLGGGCHTEPGLPGGDPGQSRP